METATADRRMGLLSPDAYGGERLTTTGRAKPTLHGLWNHPVSVTSGDQRPPLTVRGGLTIHATGAGMPSTGEDAVDPTRPTDRARHLDRQLRLVAALCPGKPLAAQLPHHGDVIGKLALEP